MVVSPQVDSLCLGFPLPVSDGDFKPALSFTMAGSVRRDAALGKTVEETEEGERERGRERDMEEREREGGCLHAISTHNKEIETHI